MSNAGSGSLNSLDTDTIPSIISIIQALILAQLNHRNNSRKNFDKLL